VQGDAYPLEYYRDAALARASKEKPREGGPARLQGWGVTLAFEPRTRIITVNSDENETKESPGQGG